MMGFGALFTLWAIIGLGLKEAFGQKFDDLRTTKFYSVSRNPQIVACTLVVLGCAMLWSSVLSVVWILLYLVIAHAMVLTEEEHLSQVHGE